MGQFENNFLQWERASTDTIDVKRIYIDMAENLNAGIMLSQLIFWFLPNKKGQKKTTVFKKGFDWVAKQDNQWLHECRLSPKQARLAASKLLKLNLIVCEKFRFLNTDKVVQHYRINWPVFEEKHSLLLNLELDKETVIEHWRKINERDGRSVTTKGVDLKGKPLPNYLKGKSGMTFKVSALNTENTTENTLEDKKIPKQEEPDLFANATDVTKMPKATKHKERKPKQEMAFDNNGKTLPIDFTLEDDIMENAAQAGYSGEDITDELIKFKYYYTKGKGKGFKFMDWNHKFLNEWINKAYKHGTIKRNGKFYTDKPNANEERIEAIRRLKNPNLFAHITD